MDLNKFKDKVCVVVFFKGFQSENEWIWDEVCK